MARSLTGGELFPFHAEAGRETLFLRDVYGWMAAGLAVTAATAWLVSGADALIAAIAINPLVLWTLLLVQLAIVFTLSARVNRLTAATASVLFLAYSVLTGVTLSVVLLLFTGESIASTFVIATGMFSGVALYGTVTRRPLAGASQFLVMGVLGIVVASIAELFWHSDLLQFLIVVAGVIVFTGLAAYDAQRIKTMAASAPAEGLGPYAVVGALALYLDFVNIFLSLLRLFSRRRA
jgi:FtsH-binding integral membrane protein